MFFVGQKVVCVDTRNWPCSFHYRPTLPKRGGVYTVRGIVPLADGHDEDGLWLAEIVNPRRLLSCPNGRRRRIELCFRMSRFRPLRATNIDVFLQMLAPVPVPEREAAPVD